MMSLSNSKHDWSYDHQIYVAKLHPEVMPWARFYPDMYIGDKPWQHNHSKDSAKYAKRSKNRLERRKAKLNPEADPGYGRYSGWG